MDEWINSKEIPLLYCGCWNSLLISWQHSSLKLLPTSINSLVSYSILNFDFKIFSIYVTHWIYAFQKKTVSLKTNMYSCIFLFSSCSPRFWVPSVFSLLYKAYPTCKYYLKCHFVKPSLSSPCFPGVNIPPPPSYICLMSYILWYAFIW